MTSRDRILAVDDNPMNLAVVEEIFQSQYQLYLAGGGQEALDMAVDVLPDVVLLDVMMPRPDGYEVCRSLKSLPALRHTQVIMVSAKTGINDRLKGYRVGADDYVTRPFIGEELLAKVRVSLRNKTSVEDVHSRMDAMCGPAGEVANMFSHLRDRETGEHLDRVKIYSHLLANGLRLVSPDDQVDEIFLKQLDRASPLHDIGKVAIPEEILNKSGALTDEEREHLQRHTVLGEQILKRLAEQSPDAKFFSMAADIARWHHEAFDGSGYPDGLRGDDIPLAAQIVKLADVFDALTSTRVYQTPRAPKEALEYLNAVESNKYDPNILSVMNNMFDCFAAVCECPNPIELSLLASMSTTVGI